MTEIKPSSSRPLLARVFVSPDEPRLRAGWRLLIQIILMIVLLIVAGIMILTPAMLLGFPPENLILGKIAELLAITGSIFLARKLLDRRSIVSLGLKVDKQAWMDILVGILITFVLMGAIYFSMTALGWLRFESFAWQSEPLLDVLIGSLGAIFLFILVGWNEELLARGYHLQTIASGLNLTWGVILSSAIFGLLHLGNPGASWVSTAGIFFAGLFLAYAYLRTKQLWLSMGLHIGWNFCEGTVFGFPVSGLDIYRLVHHNVIGPELWTGGDFGPEAGLIVLPALALGCALIYFYTGSLRKSSE
jgi:uncharacterized protein